MRTPWGESDSIEHVAGSDIVFVGTPLHGGFKLTHSTNLLVKDEWRNADGWYEEDCEWSKVVLTFPYLFSEKEQADAQRTMDWLRRETANAVE